MPNFYIYKKNLKPIFEVGKNDRRGGGPEELQSYFELTDLG